MARLKLRPRNSAFSLLEVIITVVILSVGIMVVLQALSFSTRVTGLACDITKAVFLSEDIIQELEFNEKKGQIEESQKEDTNDKFTWDYNIIDLKPDLKLYRLDFDIAWQRLNRQEGITLNSYLKDLKQ